MGYVDFPLPDDPDQLVADAVAGMTARLPGYLPVEGAVEVAVIEEATRLAADSRSLVVTVAAAVVSRMGADLFGVQPIAAQPAQATATFTLSDTAGHTIPAGTRVGYLPAGADPVGLATVIDTTVPAGQSTAAGVLLTALLPGAAGNAVRPGPLTALDALAWLSSVQATSAGAGGVDAETDLAYRDRLVADIALAARTVVSAADAATYARNTAGVFRCLAVDGYDSQTSTAGVPLTVSVYPVDQAGQPVPPAVAAAVAAALGDPAVRVANLVVRVGQPTYTAVQVAYTVAVQPGAPPADVQLAVSTTVAAYLSPSRWSGGGESPPAWHGDSTVRLLDLARLVGNIDGVRYVTSLTLNGGTADVVLPGAAPLPATTSTVTGTAS